MKILFFSDHFKPEPSAPAAHVYERAQMWCESGHDVTVICAAPNFPEGKVYEGYKNRWRFIEKLDGIRVVRVKTLIVPNSGFALRILDYLSYAVSAFVIALFEPKPDVVVSTSPHLFVPVAAAAFAGVKGCPHVMEVRDLWPASIVAVEALKKGLGYRLLERLELHLYRVAKRILVLTGSFKKDLEQRGVDPAKIHVVLGGANLELFSPRSKDPGIVHALQIGDSFVVGYLGTLGLAHGLENVLAAAELLRQEKVVFLIVGDGAARGYLDEIIRRRRIDNVLLLPRKLREEMPAYLSVCDVSLIHLKDRKVFSKVIPSKIFESMAMGIPILYVGPRGEGVDIVEAHGAGEWVRPEDPAALASAVVKLRNDGTRRNLLACNAEKAAPLYSRRLQAEGTLSVLSKAIG